MPAKKQTDSMQKSVLHTLESEPIMLFLFVCVSSNETIKIKNLNDDPIIELLEKSVDRH